ncbi:amino acid ABC transporter permease [Pseudoglutamicibacter albus]|uniref:amino acid ABC transporter permease n=1 Tax=Pseudoglutamicibacter TaxID=1742991 RepID=UPI000C777B99|nr:MULTISPECIES: amino acid ABC transporter permease [Pseudoglutamicibacter]MCT1685656.1 amino acid ABC transporter permease [Pseudoglutamicibacter cumminsii]PKY79885.1 amino acid ABC transporter permease [Pseudoglutamicibacter albus]WIK84008.1 amino acid ABC transporter permease [Pseudoglutamicibacter albus]
MDALAEFWRVLTDNSDIYIRGFKMTLLLFAVSGIGSLILGTIVGAMRVSPVPVMRAVGTFYVNAVRNTPLTLILMFFALGYPKLASSSSSVLPKLDFVQLAMVGLTLYTATYVAEALRSGINTVPLGQAEAARAVGLTFGQSMTQIILPQAFRATVPPMFSVFIALLKNTTVAAAFGVVEAGTIRQYLSERSEPQLQGLIWVAIIFVALVMLLSMMQRYFERKWKVA